MSHIIDFLLLLVDYPLLHGLLPHIPNVTGNQTLLRVLVYLFRNYYYPFLSLSVNGKSHK